MSSDFQETHSPHTELGTPDTPEAWAEEEARWEPKGLEDTETLGLAAHGHRAVIQALTQRGVREAGGEDNGIPLKRYVRYFIPGSGPLPWCAFFVSWCFDTTGDRNHQVPWGNAGYVGSIYSWAKGSGRLVGTPQHGDIFGIDSEHTGLVAGANPAKKIIWTIEGNYGDAVSQRNIAYSGGGTWFARM